MSRAAFLDRDGTLNRKPPDDQYVTRWEQLQFLPGVAEAIASLNRAGFLVIVVSNQRCVAKGLVSAADLERIHRQMCSELATKGARIDRVYYCPHEEYPGCSCRKPAPGMLFAAGRAHKIDLAASWMIGDSEVDMQAGRSAGCRTARVLANGGSGTQHTDITGSSLLDVVEKLLRREPALDDQRTNKLLVRKSLNAADLNLPVR